MIGKFLIPAIVLVSLCFLKSSNCQNLCAYESNIEYICNTNEIIRTAQGVNSIDACCALCSQDSRCQAWTHSSIYNTCQLRTRIGTRSQNLRRGVASGRRPTTVINPIVNPITPIVQRPTTSTAAPILTTRISGCLIDSDANYPGQDLVAGESIANYGTVVSGGAANVNSAADCCNLCGAIAVCQSFAYSVQDRYCFFKRTDWTPDRRQTYPGIISGSVRIRG